MKRRSFMKYLVTAPVAAGAVSASRYSALQAKPNKPKHILVIGAGAFGGWTALNLLRKGARVTLIDAIEAGNPLASSGGETRVIRHAYRQRIYVDLVVRALQMWKESDQRWGTQLFNQKGVLFMGQERDFIDTAMTHMQAAGVNTEILQAAEISKRYPQLNPEKLKWAVYEPDAGYLTARLACIAVRDAFIEEGGEYRLGRVSPGGMAGGEMGGVLLEDGSQLRADQYVFACGPWLREMFPDIFTSLIKVTRQELYYFKPPVELNSAFNQDLPVWAEVGEPFYYGIPGHDGIFKIGDDTRGPEVDPTTHSRAPTQSGIDKARAFMEYRFPGMKNAPLVDARVCQYSETKDHDFIIDHHPQAQNTWLVGGGSGHGFKHGPALGELIADQVLGNKPPEKAFLRSRFD